MTSESMDEFELKFYNLGKHLDPIRQVIAEFCTTRGFEHIPTGRYPRILICKKGECNQWIELLMSLDEDGERRNTFFENVPYELGAGAYYDVEEISPPKKTRYSEHFTYWDAMPFSAITTELFQNALEECHRRIDAITTMELLASGVVIDLTPA